MIETQTVTNWIDAYRRAWDSNDPDDIQALFTEDGVYRFRPDESDPATGHEALVAAWLRDKDEPGDTTFDYEVLGVSGDRAFVQAVTNYLKHGDVYDNLWVIDFTADGRARSFTEWFMKRKAS